MRLTFPSEYKNSGHPLIRNLRRRIGARHSPDFGKLIIIFDLVISRIREMIGTGSLT
jgi:hypothetical protein